MPIIRNLIIAELDPSKPVTEVCGVIASLIAHSPHQEAEILLGIRKAIDTRLTEIEKKTRKEADKRRGQPLREPEPSNADS